MAEVPPADIVTKGGETATERRCTYLELALALAPGLDAAGIAILYKVAKPALEVCVASIDLPILFAKPAMEMCVTNVEITWSVCHHPLGVLVLI